MSERVIKVGNGDIGCLGICLMIAMCVGSCTYESVERYRIDHEHDAELASLRAAVSMYEAMISREPNE